MAKMKQAVDLPSEQQVLADKADQTRAEAIITEDTSDKIKSTSCVAVHTSTNTGTGRCEVGIAAHHADSNTLLVAEFDDDNRNTNLECALNALSPLRVLTPKGRERTPEHAQLMEICERNELLLQAVDKNIFTGDAAVVGKDLDKLLRGSKHEQKTEMYHSFIEKADLMKALGALISCEKLLSESSNVGQYMLKQFSFDAYVGLNSGALFGLGLQHQKSTSLFHLLNRCRTAPGQRLLGLWLKQPLRNVQAIQQRLAIVEFLVKNNELRRKLGETFKKLPDFERMAKRAERESITLADAYKLRCALRHIPSFIELLQSSISAAEFAELKPHFYAALLRPLKDLCMPVNELDAESDGKSTKKVRNLAFFCQAVEKVLDVEFYEKMREFRVRPELNDLLNDCDNKLKKIMQGINAQHRKISDMVPGTPIKLENASLPSYDGWHMRVTRQNEKSLRECKLIVSLGTRNTGFQFVTEAMKDLNQQYTTTRIEYQQLEQELVAELAQVARSYSNRFRQLSDLIAPLDVWMSLAEMAFTSQGVYSKPTILPAEAGIIQLIQSRHPLLDTTSAASVIPNDVVMCRSTTKDAAQTAHNKSLPRFHIITGPNMGGKSTLLKQVGICTLLAQIGAYVPAQEATISVVDKILARVGAGDHMLAGVSTFMAEMLEMSSIVEAATENSLVIIDELGRGTSTFDGFGLAYAIGRHLATDNRCYCLFATHFHELTRLADEMPNMVCNRHMQAIVDDSDVAGGSEGRLTLLYQVAEGACDESFGIDVARMAGFPSNVVDYARERLLMLEAAAGKFVAKNVNGSAGSADVVTDSTPIEPEQAHELMRELKSKLADEFAKIDADNIDGDSSGADADRLKAIVSHFFSQPKVANNAYMQRIRSN